MTAVVQMIAFWVVKSYMVKLCCDISVELVTSMFGITIWFKRIKQFDINLNQIWSP